MKNFANFGLWFYFVYVVLKWLFSSDIIKNLKNNLLWILIAWVWIQASWFFTAVVLDVSSVAMAAVWSFPSMIISQDETVESAFNKFGDLELINKEFKEWYKIHLFDSNSSTTDFLTVETVELQPPVKFKDYLDSIMPNEKDVSWPLYYIGYSILHTMKMPSIDDTSFEAIKATIFNAILQWWTTIVFSIEMMVLCIAALIRMVYLWMFIFLSPVAVLIFCISQTGDNKLMKSSLIAPLWKHINFKTFFWNVFKPVIVVLWLWIAVILVSLMGKLMGNDNTGKEIDVWWVKFKSVEVGKNAVTKETKYDTSMESDFLGLYIHYAWKALLDFVLCIITILMVYYIVKIAMKMWGGDDFVSKRIGKIQDDVWDIMSSLPVMPVKSYDNEWVETTRFIGAGDVFGLSGKDSLLEKKVKFYKWKVETNDGKQRDAIINSWFGGIETVTFESSDKTRIKSDSVNEKWLQILTTWFDKIKELGKKPVSEWWLDNGQWYGMILNRETGDKWWKERFEGWLTDMKNHKNEIQWADKDIWIRMIERWNNPNNQDKDKHTLQNLFEHEEENYMWAYSRLFGLNNVTSLDELMRMDISKKSG